MTHSLRFPHARHAVVILIMVAALWGCTHTSATEIAQPPDLKSTDHYQVLIREARAEAAMLRSELATLKIATAKQNAELQSAQRAGTTLRQREDELASELQHVKANISSLQAERDQLRRQNSDLQSRAASVPELRQLVMDIRALQTSVQQMVSSMQTLSSDITKIKQEMLNTDRRFRKTTPKLTALPTSRRSGSTTRRGIVTVAPGDTLWKISQAHGISVKTLKDMNNLKTDFIIVGQKLNVPVSDSSRPNQNARPDTQAALEKVKAKKKSKVVTTGEGSINTNEAP